MSTTAGTRPTPPPPTPPGASSGKGLLDELKVTFSPDNPHFWPGALISGLIVLLIASYWNSLAYAAINWDTPMYSHGWMVPLFAIVMLWMWWQPIEDVPMKERWWGAGLISGSVILRVVTGYYNYKTVDMMSFIPAVIGVFLLVGGKKSLRWSLGPVLFLVFMYPLPMKVYQNSLKPLQEINTKISTYVLQTIGQPAYRIGNRILIGETELTVEEACSGLRMTTIFVAMCVAFCMVVKLHWWERVVILLSAVPIALVSNLIRIVATSLLYKLANTYPDMISKQTANTIFHDGAGWFMMPIGLGLLYLTMKVVEKLIIVEEEKGPTKIPVRGQVGLAGVRR